MSAGKSDELVRFVIGLCVDRGIDYEPYLPTEKESYTAREVVNACGKALTAAGVPNNLEAVCPLKPS